MNDIITAYKDFSNTLKSIEKYVQMTFLKSNGIQTILDNYSGDNKDLLDYYKSIVDSQIQYNAIIINLYGAYEKFINEITKYYLLYLFNHCDEIEKIPKKICDKYEKAIGEFLCYPNRFVYTNLTSNNAIKNYYSFINSNFSSVDTGLLLSHSGNLKSSQLDLFLKEFGLLNNKNLSDSVFIEKYYIENDIYDKREFDALKSRKVDELFKPLNALVISRNNVAHSGEDENRISHTTLIDETIPFLHTIGRAVLDHVIISATNYYEKVSEKQFSIIRVINNSILCVNNKTSNIKVGDIVVYKHKNETKNAIIKRIEINNTPVVETGEKETDVGMELDNTISKDDSILFFLM